MYKTLTIGGKEYKLEYTIEASLYDECIERLINFLGKTLGATNEPELAQELTEEEKTKLRGTLVKNSISGISNLPATALTVFYAGLMEHHGETGDRTVMSKADAKAIVKEYFKQHAEDGKDNFYDLLNVCMDQMGEDDFFRRTGLEKVVSQAVEEQKKKTGNRAQRRAATKASGK